MKYLRILALLMAAMLCLTACSSGNDDEQADPTAAPADEAAADTSADAAGSTASVYESFMIKSLGMSYESWMTETMYPAFAATFFMDMAYEDAFGITELSTASEFPAVYVGELNGDNYGNGMNLCMFFTDAEDGSITMINSTVFLATGMFEGERREDVTDPAAEMEQLVSDGVLQVYHEISYEDFMTAYAMLTQAMSDASSETEAE